MIRAPSIVHVDADFSCDAGAHVLVRSTRTKVQKDVEGDYGSSMRVRSAISTRSDTSIALTSGNCLT